jgi:pimeloyl-ACP methyl ester carboxylesterase
MPVGDRAQAGVAGRGSAAVTLKEGETTWRWSGASVRIGLDRLGSGPSLLLVPALSSISTRREMRGLQERLADSYSTLAVDWPGFGDKPRPPIAWSPDAYRAFLAHLFSEVVPRPFATIAAGHAASYLLACAASQPGSAGRLCLVAPTWRGPLPTVADKRLRIFQMIARAADVPIVGRVLYRLNVNRPMIKMMARGHVYADPAWLTDQRADQKLAVARAKGARHASVRFVTGLLDPVLSRSEWLALAESISEPMLMILGADTPAKSRAEMEALGALPRVRTVVLPAGKLSVHEEFPDAVADAVLTFLKEETA